MTAKIPVAFIGSARLCEKINHGHSWLFYSINPRSPRYLCDFPKPTKIGRSLFWLESEIDAWMLRRVEEYRSAEHAGNHGLNRTRAEPEKSSLSQRIDAPIRQ